MTTTPLRIEGEMTIYRAAELKQALLDALQPGAVLELDLSGVTDIDSAGLQLLMLTKTTAKASGGDLKFASRSPVVLEVIELLNLAEWFGDPLVIPPRASSTSSARQ